MTKKHYIAIAKIIAEQAALANQRQGAEQAVARLCGVANGLADLFANDNPSFDKSRFVTTCFGPGPKGPKA
jgi:hypothetical protein